MSGFHNSELKLTESTIPSLPMIRDGYAKATGNEAKGRGTINVRGFMLVQLKMLPDSGFHDRRADIQVKDTDMELAN